MSAEEGPPPEDSEASAPARPVRARWLRRALLLLLLLGLLAGGGYRLLEYDFDRPADPGRSGKALFRVRPGSGLGQVARSLGEKGLIRNPLLFRLQVRLRGGARRIRSGFYRFSPAMPPRRIYQDLIEGRVATATVTFPEGSNLREIAAALERAGLAGRAEVLALARDPALLSRLKAGGDSLEGYLFPDTYRFPLGTPPAEILRVMADTMRRKVDASLLRRAAGRGLTLHQVLTLASIVEKETSVEAERPLIAAVFLNRLKRKMRLQSDPTVIYALPRFDGNLRRSDLAYDSPYNTYRVRGLPPGPIANPGLASIRAVLHPAPVAHLYFVATQKGGHKFSRTYREHQRAVARYQLWKRGKVDR